MAFSLFYAILVPSQNQREAFSTWNAFCCTPAAPLVPSAAPEFVEAAGYAGFRFLTVDLEHTYYGPEKTVEMVRAGEAADLCVLACATPS